MMNRRYGSLLIALGALLLLSCVLSLGFGPARGAGGCRVGGFSLTRRWAWAR